MSWREIGVCIAFIAIVYAIVYTMKIFNWIVFLYIAHRYMGW